MNHCRAVRVPIMMIRGPRPFHRPAKNTDLSLMVSLIITVISVFVIYIVAFDIERMHP